jgi:hypothetical protein
MLRGFLLWTARVKSYVMSCLISSLWIVDGSRNLGLIGCCLASQNGQYGNSFISGWETLDARHGVSTHPPFLSYWALDSAEVQSGRRRVAIGPHNWVLTQQFYIQKADFNNAVGMTIASTLRLMTKTISMARKFRHYNLDDKLHDHDKDKGNDNGNQKLSDQKSGGWHENSAWQSTIYSECSTSPPFYDSHAIDTETND